MSENNNISVNMENLTDEERKQLLALIEKANTPKVLKPKENERYFTICSYGCIDTYRYSKDGNTHDERIAIGNYFRTREEAEFMVERLKVIQELKEIANGFNPIKEKAENYYCLCYLFGYEKIDVFDCYGDRYFFTDVHFESEEIAKKAIKEIGEDRLKKYYFCME